ncbi:hypothetical protein SEUCBS139899_000514 [Sporothrix eucalyptigena]
MADEYTIFYITGPESLILNTLNKNFVREVLLEYDESPESPEPAGYESDTNSSDSGQSWNPSKAKILRITTKDKPANVKEGFVIGSDPEKCDIVLNSNKIGGKHIALRFNLDYGTVLIHNYAKNGTGLRFLSQNEKGSRLRSNDVLLKHERAEIDFGNSLLITIVREDEPIGWMKYCALARRRQLDPHNVGRREESSEAGSSSPTTARKHTRDFRIITRLGKGGMGDVHMVTERRTGNLFAMKEFKEKMREEEKRTLMHLRHDHIVRYAGFLPGDSSSSEQQDLSLAPYRRGQAESEKLLMEFIDGPDLEKELTQRPFTSDECREILLQVLEAVAYLHKNKITHRDIKPSNVVLVSRNPINIKLVDFGFASEKSTFNTSCGTKLFVGPEIILVDKSERKCTNKVDIYAIGVLVMCLRGETFGLEKRSNPTVKECYDSLEDCLNMWKNLGSSRTLEQDLAVLMLEKDPKDRPTAEECLRHPFFRGSAGQKSIPDGVYTNFSGARTIVADSIIDASQTGSDEDKILITVTPPDVVPSKRSKLSPASSAEELVKHRRSSRPQNGNQLRV